MKKNLFYAFALIGSMSLFTACSDDDNKGGVNKELLEELNTTFTTGNESASFALTYSDASMVGKTATFNSADGKTATIVLAGTTMSQLKSTLGVELVNPGVVPGETSTTLNVNLTPVGETGFAFEGTDEANGRTLTYKGTIEKGKLSMDVDVAFADNDLTGTWNLYPYVPYADVMPAHIVWQSSVPFKVSFISGTEPTEIQPEWFLNMVAALDLIPAGETKMTLNKSLASLLKSISFGKDGNIIASYSDAANMTSPVWQESSSNMIHYVVKNGKLYAYLNIDAIMGAASGQKSTTKALDLASILQVVLSKLPELAPMLTEGIPLGYTIAEDGMLSVYIDKDGLGAILIDVMIELMQSEDLKNALLEFISSNPGFSMFAGMINDVLAQFPETAAATSTLELGLNFTKNVAE